MRAQAFDCYDVERLCRVVGDAEDAAAADVVRLAATVGPLVHAVLTRTCRFAHRAILLFPTRLDDAIADLATRGLDVIAPVPSVVVRGRLCSRYGLDYDACDVSVTRLRTPSSTTGHNLEVFLFPATAPALEPAIVDAERRFGFEEHLAFEVCTPHLPALERLVLTLEQDGGLVFEGGGHNPNEGPMGSTVLYFVGGSVGKGPTRAPRFERFELYCQGDLSAIFDRHPVQEAAVERVYSAWAGAGRRRGARAA